LKAQRAHGLVQPQVTERPAWAVFTQWLIRQCAAGGADGVVAL